jgi:capsular polysaccharide biosynthesis protein
MLIVPSLSAQLGTISDWAVTFLRQVFLPENTAGAYPDRIYISRKKAPSRKLSNEKEFFIKILEPYGFTEFFAEDHSIQETAKYFSKASAIIGIHGSGFANLAFSNPGTIVIDVVAPRHIDAYYWLLACHNKSSYGFFYGKGERPGDHIDLVKNKVDNDVMIDCEEFKLLMQLMKLNVK